MKLTVRIIAVVLLLTCYSAESKSQNKAPKPAKLFITAGTGAGGSFFVRNYDEALPFSSPGYTAFSKKKFIGSASEFSVGLHLKKNIDLRLSYNRQRFTRHVYFDDTNFGGIGLLIDHKIQHIDHNWMFGVMKNYVRAKTQLYWGAGLYYWTGQLHTVEVFSNYVIDRETILKGLKSGDLGAYSELGYEYKFQPKVNLGIRGQFFWIVSGSYPNSIALYPYIKLNF